MFTRACRPPRATSSWSASPWQTAPPLERGGAGSVREDRRPVAEREVGGEDEALLLVASADDLEQEVGVAVVERQEPDLVDDEEADTRVVLESSLECASGFLCGEVEEELSGG